MKMQDWVELLIAMAVFMLTHMVPMLPRLKRAFVQRLGKSLYSAVYGSVSLVLLVWVIVAMERAPYVELLPWAKWQMWVPNLAMPVALWLLAAGVFSPNPLSFGGRMSERFRPDRPGIVGFVRHPLLWALLLWSASHALANPDAAHVGVFGVFAVFSAVGMVAIDRRKSQEMGVERWTVLARNTSNFPRLSALWHLRHLFPMSVVVWTLIFWIVLLRLHMPIIGVHPFPMVPEFLERMTPGQWV